MLGRAEATPCPSGLPTYKPSDSLLSLSGDNTTEIDFTTELRASLRATKPRRRQTAIGGKGRRGAVDITIHEDQALQDGFQPAALKGSILAKPPQRPKPRVSFVPDVKEVHEEVIKDVPKLGAAKRVSILVKPASNASNDHAPAAVEVAIKKPARRGTIYIPPDDTTMASMHMGIFSPIKNIEQDQAGDQHGEVELTGIAAQMAKKRGRRESFAAAPAKRVPLQQPLRAIQESANPQLLAGKKTGKENIPPGYLEVVGTCGEETKLFDLSAPEPGFRRSSLAPSANLVASMASMGADKQVKASFMSATAATAARAQPSAQRFKTASQLRESRYFRGQPHPLPVANTGERRKPRVENLPGFRVSECPGAPRLPSQLSIPDVPHFINQEYPMISEDIADPSLYEDKWLSHQEVAISQLVNSLFDKANGDAIHKTHAQQRHDLFETYQDPGFALLNKRIHASLLYGALSVPRDVLAKASRLWADLGLKERFASLWLDTYDLDMLQAGLEVVIGRECLRSPRTSHVEAANANVTVKLSSRRALRTYIETFLLRNEDATPESKEFGRDSWSYQRTIQRSLMLIKLLDKARTTAEGTTSLFLSASPHKSSKQVGQALVQMLNPSIGDVMRILSHVDYFVCHKQYPLEEFSYHVDKLAVDLRDGVRLTRLVELLLFPSASHLSHVRDNDGTTRVVMPDGETLALDQGERDWPLSQHLKFPCLGRAPKLYNVQLALSALSGVRGQSNVVKDICAEDIVDGFREKTVALLWAMAGKWGLGALIDVSDVRGETKRLDKSIWIETEENMDEHEEDYHRNRAFLKAWAKAVASSKGLAVKNFTTSFSDGKVFEAIVSEYEPHLPGHLPEQSNKLPLQDRLARLGCSAQFVKLFTTTTSGHATTHVFDRDFVLAALAFLCSRLLSTTKATRAATAIQRGWRLFWGRVLVQRKRVNKRVAEECAEVVQTREKMLGAKAVIVKGWRGYREQAGKIAEPQLNVASPASSAGDVWLSL